MLRALPTALALSFAYFSTAALVLPDDPQATPHASHWRQSVRDCPLPWCEPVPTVAELRAPGVGFALEMGYGTAVVRHHNGSYQNIVMVKGSEEYITTLAKLAEQPKARMPYVYESWMSNLDFARAKLARWWNIQLGRPATRTTAVLAEMLTLLRSATEQVIGPVNLAAISSPNHIHLRREEMMDVTSYLAMGNIMPWMDGFYAAHAAFAGSGAGLCSNYIDFDACQREESGFEHYFALHLDLSEKAFVGTISGLSTLELGMVRQSFIDTKLGTEQLVGTEASLYWTLISTAIRRIVEDWRAKKHITYLLLSGNSASNAKFKKVVRDTLRELVISYEAISALDSLQDDVVDDELVWLTARGAAELAKRKQEGPDRCRDHEEGKKRRQDQRPKSSTADQQQEILLVQS